MRRGVYPGTFNPPTIGHIEIVRTAVEHLELDELHLVVSQVPLAKAPAARPTIDERIDIISRSVEHIAEVSVHTTDLQLIAEIAHGYDVVVMGADKWRQIHDIAFYRDAAHRDEALAALPELAVAARDDIEIPPSLRLPVRSDIGAVSSTAVRAGRSDWMTEAARRSGHWD